MNTFSTMERTKFMNLCLVILSTFLCTVRCEEPVKNCLTSPGYPELYPASSSDTQELTVEFGNHIEISFQAFDLEPSTRCEYDYVAFNDGNGNAVGPKLCGGSSPHNITISTYKATVLFRSDESVEKKGFKLCYKEVTPVEVEGDLGLDQAFKAMSVAWLSPVLHAEDSSSCCAACKVHHDDTLLFDFLTKYKDCYCYKTKQGKTPATAAKAGWFAGLAASCNVTFQGER